MSKYASLVAFIIVSVLTWSAPGKALAGPNADREHRKAVAAQSNDRRDRKKREHSRRRDDRGDRRGDDGGNRRDRREDLRDDRRDDRARHYWKYRLGVRLLSLPARHRRLVIGPTVYFYVDGVYFIQQSGVYIVAAAPIGARIAILPYGFRSMYIGPRRFFRVNSTYYRYVVATNDYVVVAPPADVASAATSESLDPVIYPAAGQSEEQLDQDRYECHRWGLEQSGFDPSIANAAGQDGSDRYYRSLKACLMGRDYTVS